MGFAAAVGATGGPAPASGARCLAVVAVALVVVLWSTVPGIAMVTDADVADDNEVSAGVLDPKLVEEGPTSADDDGTTDESGVDAVRDTWEDRSHAVDGSETVNNTLAVDAGGSSLAADRVNLTVDYAENDSTLGTAGNRENTSRTVEVQSFVYAGTDLVASGNLTDVNGNGFVDLQDLTTGSNADELSSLPGIAPGERANLTVVLSGTANLIDGVGSDDGLDVTVDVRTHNGSFADPDASLNNTIQYG